MPSSQPKIREYVDIFFQRKRLFIIPFVSVFTLSIIACFLIPLVYRATVKIEISSSIFLPRQYGVSSGIKGEFGILKERFFYHTTLENVIKKAGLDKDPLFAEKMIEDLRRNTRIRMIGNYLIRVTYDGRDRVMTSNIAKIVAKTFIEESFKKREETASETIDFMQSELEIHRKRLETAEKAIHREDLLAKRLGAKLVKLEDKLVELLIVGCKEAHPIVIDVEKDIKETKEELRKVTGREKIKEGTLDEVRLEREARISEGLYKQLLDKIEAVRIGQRLKEVEERIKFRIIDSDRIHVYKVRPNKKKIAVSGFVLGILLGIGLILLAEYADHSFRGIEDAKAFLTLPILGSIPKMVNYGRKKGEKKLENLLQKETELIEQEEFFRKILITYFDPRSTVSEAYCSLRTNIQSLDIGKPLKTILVTSALPGEGKTTVATNLAVTFANVGSNVLLVDSALRQPLIDKIFALDEVPGLVEILTGGLQWTEAMNSTDIENLSIITSGKLPFNPSEILGSIKMKELIEEFKSKFDVILFDSSDVIGVTDSAVLGSKVDGVLLVVQTRKIQRETVLRSQSFLESAQARVLGCVLNQIDTNIPQWFNRYLVRLEPEL